MCDGKRASMLAAKMRTDEAAKFMRDQCLSKEGNTEVFMPPRNPQELLAYTMAAIEHGRIKAEPSFIVPAFEEPRSRFQRLELDEEERVGG